VKVGGFTRFHSFTPAEFPFIINAVGSENALRWEEPQVSHWEDWISWLNLHTGGIALKNQWLKNVDNFGLNFDEFVHLGCTF
jgi:hypothetical protein